MWPLPVYDNTMGKLLKLSPRQSYQLPKFMLQKSHYALRYSVAYFSSIWEATETSYCSVSSNLIESYLPCLPHFLQKIELNAFTNV